MAKTILSGAADANGDTPPPPAELRSILSNAQRKQLFFTPTGGSRYVALNTTKPPFDNLDVRKAVAYVLDRNAMRLTRGGAVDGAIATHFIDPSFGNEGFDQAGGDSFNPFPSPDFSGDVAKAKELMQAAGYADGMYSGPQVTMVADNTPPGSDTAKVVAADLAKIGIKARIDLGHPRDHVHEVLQRPEERAERSARTSAGCPDFHEPQAILDVTFNGKNILPSNNSNWPLLNEPAINAAMDRPRRPSIPRPATSSGARSTSRSSRTAAAVPWLWENFPTLFSARVVPALMVDNGARPTSRSCRSSRNSAWPASTPIRPPGARRRERSGARPGALAGVLGSSMTRYVVRRVLWGVVLLAVVSALTFLIFYVFPSADPAALRAGRQATPAAHRADPPRARPRQAPVRAVLDLHEGARPPLRPRLLVPEQRLGPVADPLAAPGHDLAHHRRVRGLDARSGSPIGIISAIGRAPRSTARRWAALSGHLGARLLARADRAPPLRERHREGPPLRRGGELRPAHAGSAAVVHSLLMPWFVLAAAFRRLLRADGARQPDRGHGRGLHPHRPREGAVRAARDLPPRAARRAHARSSRWPASTSGSSSAAPSSRRPSSTSPASGGTPTTRSSTPTCRRSRGPCSSAPSSSSSRTSSSTSSTRSSTRGCGTDMAAARDPDLRVRFRRATESCGRSTASPSTRPRATLGIVGESGSGKSVTALTVMGLTRLPNADGRRRGPLRRRRPPELPTTTARRSAGARRDDLPGPDVLAPPALQGGVADRRGDPGARATSRRTPPAAARSRRSRTSRSRARPSGWTATRTSSPAGCGSGS